MPKTLSFQLLSLLMLLTPAAESTRLTSVSDIALAAEATRLIWLSDIALPAEATRLIWLSDIETSKSRHTATGNSIQK
jgi:hypothetical protein